MHLETYTALLEDYVKTGDNGEHLVYARKTGFDSREAAWEWVIQAVANLWDGSQVAGSVNSYSEKDLKESKPATRPIDFAVQEKDDPARGLCLAITINEEASYANDANFPNVLFTDPLAPENRGKGLDSPKESHTNRIKGIDKAAMVCAIILPIFLGICACFAYSNIKNIFWALLILVFFIPISAVAFMCYRLKGDEPGKQLPKEVNMKLMEAGLGALIGMILIGLANDPKAQVTSMGVALIIVTLPIKCLTAVWEFYYGVGCSAGVKQSRRDVQG